MTPIELKKLLYTKDSDIQRAGLARARISLGRDFPSHLLSVYRDAKRYQTRMTCVYYAISYCRWNADALQLGIAASQDKSRFVRYRGYQLLAYSQKEAAAKHIEALLTAVSQKNVEDEGLRACHLALSRKNFNCFLDKTCSGMVFPRWTEILADGSQREISEPRPCSGDGLKRKESKGPATN